MIRVELIDRVATVTLDRAEKRNALTPEMLRHLVQGVRSIAPLDAACVVVRGEGRAFCAGFDLSLCEGDPEGGVMRSLLTGLSEAIVALRAQPRPVVIAAHGAAIAGGCALLGAADLVVTNSDAKLGYPVVRLGVSPAVSAPFLRLLVGDGPARERLLDPGTISGAEAHRLGLVSHLAATPEEVLPIAQALARDLAGKPVGAIAATRAWLQEIEALGQWPERARDISVQLTGGEEERRLLPAAWSTRPPDASARRA